MLFSFNKVIKENNSNWSSELFNNAHKPNARGVGGGVHSLYIMAYVGTETLPKRATFFRLQVYERVGILLIEVYERGVKSVIWVFERAQSANKWILLFQKVEKTFHFCDWFLFKWQLVQQQLKGMQSSKQGMWKGYYLSIERIWKGYLFHEKWYKKG